MRRKNITSEMMKEYITQSLLILLENDEYINISIGAITEKAGVNRSTYYRNFESKDSIIRFYYEGIMENYLNENSSREGSMQEYLSGMFHAFLSHKDDLLLLHRKGLSHLMLDTLNSFFASNTTEASISEQFELYYHTGGIFNSMLLWFEEGMITTPSDLAKISISFLPDSFTPFLLR